MSRFFFFFFSVCGHVTEASQIVIIKKSHDTGPWPSLFEGCHMTGFCVSTPMTSVKAQWFPAIEQEASAFLGSRDFLTALLTRLLRKTRTSSLSGAEQCWFWRAPQWGACIKRSHMEYEWQPSVNARSFSSHGQYHHPVMDNRPHTTNRRKLSPF